jgi:prepilin-type N-terminal cleavage/methylation domain-containing protein
MSKKGVKKKADMRKAFSLVELSIVIVIIALLLVAVASGSKIAHNFKLQKSIVEITMMSGGVKSFLTTYGQLPGDIDVAVDYWGKDCAYTTSGTDYCSGDGDGAIETSNGNSIKENSNALLHLVLAELIPNQGFALNTAYLSYDSEGFSNGKIRLRYTADGSSEGYNYLMRNVGNLIQFGGYLYTDDALFYPRYQYVIDKKLDDGAPRGGIITYRVIDGVGSGTAVSDASCTNSTTSYYLASNVAGCNLVYELDH